MKRQEKYLLYTLIGWSLFSAIGYSVFALHPDNLLRFPGALEIYAISFQYFAQAHVWLSFILTIVLLASRVSLRVWLPTLFVGYAVGLASETLGTATGIPFGGYAYSDFLGQKWFGLVPYLIPVSWFYIAIISYAMATHAFPQQRLPRIAAGALGPVLWDLALDPAMSYLTPYWVWFDAGQYYYGMPLVNLFGWFVTGCVIMLGFEAVRAHRWVRTIPYSAAAALLAVHTLLPVGMLAGAGAWSAIVTTAVAISGFHLYLRKCYLRNQQAIDAGHIQNLAGALQQQDYPAAALTLATLSDQAGYFARNSRTFSLASRLFPGQYRNNVQQLYTFLRISDDLADQENIPLHTRIVALQNWETWFMGTFAREQQTGTWLDELADTLRTHKIDRGEIAALFAGFRSDLAGTNFRDQAELEDYCYCVAGVVGRILTRMAGVQDEATLKSAESLGLAMQLTNILRDVGEDLRNGRIYLPADLLQKHQLSTEILLQSMRTGLVPAHYKQLLHEIAHPALAHYKVAEAAMPGLPGWYRRPVRIAARMYASILRELQAQHWDNLQQRSTVPFHRKLLAITRPSSHAAEIYTNTGLATH